MNRIGKNACNLVVFVCLFAMGVPQLIISCGHIKTRPIKEIPFEEEGIKLTLKADSMLNSYNGQATSLVLCVYQLSADTLFMKLSQKKDDVLRLLSCRSFSDDVVTNQKYVIYPGEKRTIKLDREKHTRYVGIVAGYFDSTPKQMVRRYPIPTQVEERGVISRTRKETALPLLAEIILDPKGIREDTPEAVAEDEGTDEPVVPDIEKEKPLWRKWWPWTIGGTVLLGGAIGANLASLEYKDTADESERDKARVLNGVGIAGYILAAGSVVVGIALDWTYGTSTNEDQQAVFLPLLSKDFVGLGWYTSF